MRKDLRHLEAFRVRAGIGATKTGDRFGAFCITLRDGLGLVMCIAADGDADGPELPEELLGWDHVSVKAHSALDPKTTRIPTWEQMCAVKRLFFDDEECVMQLHPPASMYVNEHPHVLHLWRPLRVEIPLPPRCMV